IERRFALNGFKRTMFLKEIGKELHLIKERIRQIEREVLKKLRKEYKKRKSTSELYDQIA
ncbi:MAG: sigma factor-like helix-turn-helix DNA-binding protein, partial [Nanoarchaeota archaeon]